MHIICIMNMPLWCWLYIIYNSDDDTNDVYYDDYDVAYFWSDYYSDDDNYSDFANKS